MNKSAKKSKLSILLIAIVAILISIIFYTIKQNNNHYTQVTNKQIESVSDNENLTILGTGEIIKDNVPVKIFNYTSLDEIGVIEATNNDGELNYKKSITTSLNKGKKIYYLGTETGLEYVTIAFLDNFLVNDTKKIKIMYKGKMQVLESKGDQGLVINLENLSGDDILSDSLAIEIYNSAEKIISSYPNEVETTATQVNVNDYYSYYYSQKLMQIITKETSYKKIDTNSDEFLASNLYDIWLYVKSANLENEKQINGIIDYILKLKSDEGFYFSSIQEKEQGEKMPSYSHLLDTKMAIETLDALNYVLDDTVEVEKYVGRVITDLQKDIEIDFVSKGGFLILISETEEIIKHQTNRIIDFDLTNLKVNVAKLYNNANPSIEMYNTAINLLECFGDSIKLTVDEGEVKQLINGQQLPNGLFNMPGYKDKTDILTTYLAIDTLVKLDLPIPKKDKLLKSISSLNDMSIIGIN